MPDTDMEVQKLKDVWDLCKSHDDQKNGLIADLFKRVQDLSEKLSETELELRDKRDVVKLNRDRLGEAEKRIKDLNHEKFQDELVKQGMDGGKKAAGLLKQAVEEKLKATSAASVHHLQVIVRVYANMKGLDKTYKELQILPEFTTIDEFVRGFNMGYSMCDYVDAGNGKECSDEKVKATFKLHLEDIHCHKILFGGTADNGYARMLEPYLQNETDRGRIILLEGPPSAQELAKIRDRFETLSFDNIFRTQKLPDTKRRVSFLMTPPRTPPVDYAAAVSKAPGAGPSVQSNALVHIPREAPSGKVLRNAQGQRVDSPLSYSQSDYVNIKPRKLCNSFHLLGRQKLCVLFLASRPARMG
ncbi:hypothetical protein ACO1O0_003522 [Amphichorda felina]